ncbi:hypothetical protein D7Z54_02295 [Salibacterium salarium]|uniref:Uncharacterized protein n=1 Tax=Salibacterium salarium TaxID=284579 RepID=A0A3R9Q6I1_9BACI|nr:hypothetical protein [Salibacterium salarium]RSL34692.1 hypothetical protein D7Z54_02295 [Salibacterium salarium]
MNEKDVLTQILGVVQSLEQRLQSVETNMITKEQIALLPTRDEVNQLVKEETKSLATKKALEDLATKEEIASLPTRDEVNQLVKEETKSLATRKALEDLATKEEIASLPTRDEVNQLVKGETKSLATKESLKELATKESVKDLATKESLKELATKEMLEGLATKDSLKDLATNEAIKDVATKNEIGALQETMNRMESKQELIYNQTGKLSEYHTDLKVEFSDVKDRISFQTHKLSEAELELFKLKKSQ